MKHTIPNIFSFLVIVKHVYVLYMHMRCIQAFQDIWANERLLDVAEQLVGTSDIMGHPVWNLRCKTPNSKATTVPWHQG